MHAAATLTLVLAALTQVQLSTQLSMRCESLWTQYGDYCYRMFGAGKTWTAARDHCLNHGGNLASVHSEGENNFLYELWRSSVPTPTSGFWFGLNDIDSEGTFVWSDGSPVDYTKWIPGQPTNYGGNEDCGHVWYRDAQTDTTRDWNDAPCSSEVSFICQKTICASYASIER
ncbi:alpha-N-acetylgalactosamine-specific lectin-like [Diadema setosum]|uniref:alpha-N-acetylgalactosamine-specific lectin-like n=1 Tax=Diadema setosum TaxID=31175 RepID=UPI003B3A82FB